jgi:hypothetical protein
MVGDISTGTIRIKNVILYLVVKTVVNPNFSHNVLTR